MNTPTPTPSASPLTELLQWHPASQPPDNDRTVLCWIGNEFHCGWWEPGPGWIGAESGGSVLGVTHWAEPAGPAAQPHTEPHTQPLTEVQIFVKYGCGTHTTNTVHGQRASSTSSAETAARALADKLFGATRGPVEETSEGTSFVRRFSASGVLQQANPKPQAAARESLARAGYMTGISCQSKPRCRNCGHCRPTQKLLLASKHDKHCSLHDHPVKTHGLCDLYTSSVSR